MPKFKWSKWRILIPAFVAGFLAIMCAGPGTLLVPAAVKMTGSVVCRQGAEIEYRRVRYGYHRPGESAVEVRCVDRDGRHSEDVFGRAVLALFGVYFVLFFAPLLFLSLRVAEAPATSEQLPVLEPAAEREVRDLLAAGRKVDAIRRVRELTGAGLRQAKDYVELLSKADSPGGAHGPGRGLEAGQAEDAVNRLKSLKGMADSGLITQQEYEAKKGEILSGL